MITPFIMPLSAVRFQVFGLKFMWMMVSNQTDFIRISRV